MAPSPKPKTVKEKVTPVEPVEEPEQKPEINFMELLNDPLAKSLLGGCKDLFKKEKPNPDTCEITIKAPSEVVLKLFKISEGK